MDADIKKTVKKILWIDDMLQWAKSAQYSLNENALDRNVDLRVFDRENGENIVQELMMFDFDLIVMDYHMEPFNGDKYISDIRSEEHLNHIPIIFYSQDPNVNLEANLGGRKANVQCVYRTELLDKIVDLLFT